MALENCPDVEAQGATKQDGKAVSVLRSQDNEMPSEVPRRDSGFFKRAIKSLTGIIGDTESRQRIR